MIKKKEVESAKEAFIEIILQKIENDIDRAIIDRKVTGNHNAFVVISEYPMDVKNELPKLIERYQIEGWEIYMTSYIINIENI